MKVVTRADLCGCSCEASINEISFDDIKNSSMTISQIEREQTIIFIDTDGTEKVLKQRF